MIRYEVTLQVPRAVAGQVEAYMRERHIPEILATGAFADIRFDRGDGAAAAADAEIVVFRTSYHAATRDDLERYLRDHSTALRADFAAHVPSSVTASRAVWGAVEEWRRGASAG